MNSEDRACRFDCSGNRLYGVLSMPEQCGSRGVLMIVGGPQYRAGSHRQFTLLARELATNGVPVLRFDYRGMGDSEGDARDFDDIDDDVRSAIDYFLQAAPDVTDVVLWGLCDAASAALFYAGQDRRVSGLALFNPWVRTEAGMAKTYLRHYYGARLMSPEFWGKILRGRFDYAAAGRSFWRIVRSALQPRGQQTTRAATAKIAKTTAPVKAPLPDRMLDGYRGFNGKVLLILSGNDYTAKEFADLTAGSASWTAALTDARTRRYDLADANHTFSTAAWRRQVGAWTLAWLKSW